MADASEARKDTAETAQDVRNRFQSSADRASGKMRESGERAAETAGQTAGATADFTRRTAREARDATVLGIPAVAPKTFPEAGDNEIERAPTSSAPSPATPPDTTGSAGPPRSHPRP